MNTRCSSSSGPASGPRIALLGPYGSGNLGDAAIQEAAIRNLRRLRPDVRIYGIGANPQDTLLRHGIECVLIEPSESANRAARIPVIGHVLRTWSVLRFFSSARRLMASTDLLVISGGGQIDDYWGGPWGHPFTVLLWTVAAKLAGTPVAVVSIGSDVLASNLSKLFFRTALGLAGYRSFRDRKSLRYVETELNVRGRSQWVPDLAFSLPAEPSETAQTECGDRSLVVGISPISHAAWTSADDVAYERYLAALRAFVSRLRDRGFHVRLFPSQVRMDFAPLQTVLATENEETARSGSAVTVDSVESLDDMLRELDACDIVVAARLHGVLLSVLMRTPVIAVSYNRKVRTLMEEIGCPEFCLEVDQVTVDRLDAMFDDAIARRTALVTLENEKVSEWMKMLDQQYRDILALLGQTHAGPR
jgi:polysaccharide pyruvyl transferase WcaK-like protein